MTDRTMEALKDALERIAVLDEADGHELTAKHAHEAVAIATSTLGKHPSEIFASRRAALTPSPPAQEDWEPDEQIWLPGGSNYTTEKPPKPVPPQEGGIAEVEGFPGDVWKIAQDLIDVARSMGWGMTTKHIADAIMKDRAARAAELSRLSAIVKAQKEALRVIASKGDCLDQDDLRRARALSDTE